jgi:hypothetical protein
LNLACACYKLSSHPRTPRASKSLRRIVRCAGGRHPRAARIRTNPAISAVEGDAESVEMLSHDVLTYRGHLAVTSDATTFHYAYTRELLRNGAVVRTKTWQEVIPRDLQ